MRCSLACAKMVPRGLEPRTFRLLAKRSNQLSYETTCTESVAKRKRRQTPSVLVAECRAGGVRTQFMRAGWQNTAWVRGGSIANATATKMFVSRFSRYVQKFGSEGWRNKHRKIPFCRPRGWQNPSCPALTKERNDGLRPSLSLSLSLSRAFGPRVAQQSGLVDLVILPAGFEPATYGS